MTLAEQLKNTLLDELRGGKTQTQLAKDMGMTQVQVSRMESRILKRLREMAV